MERTLMGAKPYYDYVVQHGWHRDYLYQFCCLASAYQYAPVYRLLNRFDLGDEVLDWGCGNGHFSGYLTAHGVKTVGFSFIDCPRPLAKQPLFEHVRGSESNPVRLPFEDGRFATVFSIGVLEHVWETGGRDEASMREIFRVLRPGGRFVCVHLPNQHGWIERFARTFGLVEHFHEKKYTARDIHALAGDTGFQIEDIGRYNFLPRNQLRKLPRFLCDTTLGAGLINTVDSILSSCAPRYLHNYYFVARKPT
jgi:SAM-dependent methyltransferase